MATAEQDTEITLGTGRMLAIFFAFVLVCAFFFAIGFSLGRKTVIAGGGTLLSAPIVSSSNVVRPSPGKNDAPQQGPQDFGFYKAVGEKTADSGLGAQDAKAQAPAPAPAAAPSGSSADAKDATTQPPTAVLANGGYYVQVAAVSRQEDAESLVEALKKRQYPAFTANNNASDKFYHVQVGPYGDLKEAETMRTRLISDGYNPIVKK